MRLRRLLRLSGLALLLSMFSFTMNAQLAKDGKFISLLLLVDVSGSMEGRKIETAKQSAKDMVDLYSRYNCEIAILAYDGPCSMPISSKFDFSKDYQAAKNFISTLKADGRTPLCKAYKNASNYMHYFRDSTSEQQLMFVLGDGGDDCHCLDETLADLKSEGKLYQTEAIGLEVDSVADAQLRQIAKETNGIYLYAETVFELPEKFAMLTVKPLLNEIVINSRRASNTTFVKHSDELIKHKINNATWVLDSISLKMPPETFFPMKIKLKDIPHSFMFKGTHLDYFLYKKNKWQKGDYTLDGNQLDVKARIESDKKTHYPFKIAEVTDKKLRLCLQEYEGEKYSCKEKIKAGETSVILYLSRIE